MAEAPVHGLCPPKFAAVRAAFEGNFAEGLGRALRLNRQSAELIADARAKRLIEAAYASLA